jgi:hypothetical protein
MIWVGGNLIWFKRVFSTLRRKKTGERLFASSMDENAIWAATAWLSE